jgi:hypothetical protein
MQIGYSSEQGVDGDLCFKSRKGCADAEMYSLPE